MNGTEQLILGMLGAIIGLTYLIANRFRSLIDKVECIHDFVHWYGDMIDESNPLTIEPKEPSPFSSTSRPEHLNSVQKWDEGP